jgi:surface antigen
MARCGSYTYGQCTWGACQEAGWVPDNLGDGGDWAARAAARGYQVTGIPTAGAIVCYAKGDGYSPFGHVGMLETVYDPDHFLVREMNFAAWNAYDQRVSNRYDVAGFILPPGVSPGQPGGGGMGAGPGGGVSGTGPIDASWAFLQLYLNRRAPDQQAWMSQLYYALGSIG